MHIFVSYSRKDSDLVSALVEDLEALGHQVWFDRELVRVGGQNWWNNLLDNIRKCDLFVFALTPVSLTSEACRREYQYASAVNKRILPIMLAPVNILTLPPELQELQLLPFTERSKKQSLAIAASMSNLPPARPLPDPLPPQPDIPLSPLTQIVTTLEKPSLSASEQIELVFELEVLLANQTTHVGAQDLLQKLYARRDTTRSVADKIRALMSEANDDGSIPAQRKPAGAELPVRGIAVFVGALIVLVVGGIALKLLSSNAGTPTPDGSTKVAQAETQPVSITATPIIPTSTPNTSITAATTSIPSTQPATAIPPVTANNQWTPQIQAFDGVDMVLVPPGCFVMGTQNPPKGYENEQPTAHICFDKPFWIDKTEVTQAQFKKFGGQAATPSSFKGDNRPVEGITWFEAADFCATKRGGRLPTEAEWEYAARGPDDLIYPWGNDYVAANVVGLDNSGGQTADVGSKADGKSWVGAFDMLGNVWEWTSTIYDPQRFAYPYNANDGREAKDDTKSWRVVRGGSWSNAAGILHSAVRANFLPINGYNYFGFRCIRS